MILNVFSQMTPKRSHEHWITSLDINALNGFDPEGFTSVTNIIIRQNVMLVTDI